MRFIIGRTSRCDKKPCKEAKQEIYTQLHHIYAKRFEDVPSYQQNPEKFKKEWYGSGKNHRMENGIFTCDGDPTKVWVIEVNTLDDLLKLKEKYGRLILGDTWDEFKEKEAPQLYIEIYDDYRE